MARGGIARGGIEGVVLDRIQKLLASDGRPVKASMADFWCR